MRYNWKRNKADQLLTSLLSFIFLWQFLLLPLSFSDQRTVVSNNYYISLKSYEEAFIIHKFIGNVFLNYIGNDHFFERSIREIRWNNIRDMEAILHPVVILGIILLFILTSIKRIRKRIPILSISLGGHAPPIIMINQI
jgi:hypothetical protein